MCTGLNWFRIGSSDGLLCTRQFILDSLNGGKCLDQVKDWQFLKKKYAPFIQFPVKYDEQNNRRWWKTHTFLYRIYGNRTQTQSLTRPSGLLTHPVHSISFLIFSSSSLVIRLVSSAIGSLNCSQIRVIKPRIHGNKNVNTNNFSSLNLQATYITQNKCLQLLIMFGAH